MNEKANKLSKSLKQEFSRFMEFHPPEEMIRNMRHLLLEYVMSDSARESTHFKDVVFDLEGLFELLEVAARETHNSNEVETHRNQGK